MPVEGSYHLEREAWDLFKQASDPEADTYGLRMSGNAWIVWGSWARALQNSGNHMYRAPDQLHWDIFNDGGHRGFAYAVNSILEGVAPEFDQVQSVAGEFGDPFSAGKMATYWTGGGVGGRFRASRIASPGVLAPSRRVIAAAPRTTSRTRVNTAPPRPKRTA